MLDSLDTAANSWIDSASPPLFFIFFPKDVLAVPPSPERGREKDLILFSQPYGGPLCSTRRHIARNSRIASPLFLLRVPKNGIFFFLPPTEVQRDFFFPPNGEEKVVESLVRAEAT